MEEEKYWLRFVQSGKIDDYIMYSSARRSREISEGRGYAVHDRSISDKRSECGGERPFGDSSYT